MLSGLAPVTLPNMADTFEVGLVRLTIEDTVRVAREGAPVRIAAPALARIAQGRLRLEELMARGERIYGVNTGVGGNVGISLPAEKMELLQHNLVRHLGCATGQPLPSDVVRAAMLLRLGHVFDRRFGGPPGIGRSAGRAAEPRHHAGGAALRIGGRERRPDALRLYRARAGGNGRGRIRGPPYGRRGSARSRRFAAHPRSRPRKAWR